MDATDAPGRCNGWTFDPSREVWWARTGPNTWAEVKGELDDPPAFPPPRDGA